MANRRKLSDVEDPAGRVDVALYRIAERLMESLENRQGVAGLREHVLPIVEQAIAQNIPAENMIPMEIQGILNVLKLNQGKPQ